MTYKIPVVLIFFLHYNISSMGQDISGVYNLTGIHEMAAAFEFRKDSSFRFMYSYGAADRSASGKYSIKDGKIILASDKEPGKDFTIIAQSKKGHQYTIKINAPNKYLAKNVICVAFVGEQQQVHYAGEDGEVSFDTAGVKEIYVQHILYPDILTLIRDKDNDHTFFELSLNPSLEQVSFKGIDLIIQDNVLTCLPNYFMPFHNIRFVKQQ